jgi:hypothetical protein
MNNTAYSDAARKAARVLAALHLSRPRRVKSLSKVRQRDREVSLHWRWKSHIRGLGFGYKRADSRPDLNQPCVTFYVRRKLPEHRIPQDERIPETLQLASVGRPVVTDVIEMRQPVLAHAAANIQPGVDVAHRFGEAGTLGVLVRMGANPAILAASCSHVLAREGLASEGDFVEHPMLISLSGGEQNEFGHLTSTFTVLNQSDTFEEDFALAAIDVRHTAALSSNGTIIDNVADSTPGFSPETPTSLQGFISRDVPGKIINPEWHGVIEMPLVGNVQFQNLVPYSPGGVAGDSGAAVLAAGTSTVFGLHVGGSDSFGLFMPLWPIFQRLGLSLVTS